MFGFYSAGRSACLDVLLSIQLKSSSTYESKVSDLGDSGSLAFSAGQGLSVWEKHHLNPIIDQSIQGCNPEHERRQISEIKFSNWSQFLHIKKYCTIGSAEIDESERVLIAKRRVSFQFAALTPCST